MKMDRFYISAMVSAILLACTVTLTPEVQATPKKPTKAAQKENCAATKDALVKQEAVAETTAAQGKMKASKQASANADKLWQYGVEKGCWTQ